MKQMHSLKQLLELGDYSSISTKQTGIDPDTGKISWDVEYYVDFSEVIKNIDRDIKDLQSAVKESSIIDRDIELSINAIKLAKQKILKTLKNKYPEKIKNY
jgi:hypothetical protein